MSSRETSFDSINRGLMFLGTLRDVWPDDATDEEKDLVFRKLVVPVVCRLDHLFADRLSDISTSALTQKELSGRQRCDSSCTSSSSHCLEGALDYAGVRILGASCWNRLWLHLRSLFLSFSVSSGLHAPLSFFQDDLLVPVGEFMTALSNRSSAALPRRFIYLGAIWLSA